MQLSEIRTAFIEIADDPDITTTQGNLWINFAYRLLLSSYDWSFMIGNGTYTVTSGTQETAFTDFDTSITDFAKPLRVWIASSSGSDKIQLDPIRYEDRNIAGLVNKYYITPDNLSIGLVPTPTNSTDVVTVDYKKSVTDLSSETDEPVFISDFHQILVWKAIIPYQKREREVSDEYEFSYNEILREMIKFYKMPQSAMNPLLSRGIRKNRTSSDSPFNI